MTRTASILALSLTALLLLSCSEENTAQNIDPKRGLDCFESQRANFPAGTQYEGIDAANDQTISIRVMTGVELKSIDCRLNADGTLDTGR